MKLSTRGQQMAHRSGIRSIMDDIAGTSQDSDESHVNLSPGNPAHIPEVVGLWQELTRAAVEDHFTGASSSYGPSRGTNELVAAIVEYFSATYGWAIRPDNVVIGPGSQMLAFVLATLYTGREPDGSRRLVLPRLPDYTGYQGLGLDAGGVAGVEPLVVHEGERRFRYAVDTAAVEARDDIGMLLVSDPANPSGSTLHATELRALVDLAARRGVPLVVDNAYGRPFPRIVPTRADPVLHPSVVNLFTFSKAGLPGERIAFAIGPADVVEPMVSFIANTALHGPQLAQMVAAQALTTRLVDRLVVDHIEPHYRAKRVLAERLLAESMPADLNWRLHSAESGMFCWLHIDHDWFDDVQLYEMLKLRRTFVVPGRHFFGPASDTSFLRTHGRRCVRLSLSKDEWTIAEGVRRLGSVLEELRTAVAVPT